MITENEAARKVEAITGEPPQEADFAAVSKKAILIRLLHNLMGAAQREKDRGGLLRYLDAILAVEADANPERFMRAVLQFQSGLHDAARADCEYLLDHQPTDIDLDRVRDLHRALKDAMK